jgi:DNA helicase-2/ATP-dependent DNA helicase PcrA
MNSKGLLYSNRLAKFIDCCSATEKIVARIEKYFDFFFLDEVQDIAGHDFNLLIKLSCANVNILLVGDFYQHTFDTSRDGNVNRTLYDDYQNYRRRFEDAGFTIDDESLVKSHRCSTSVCEFITTKIGIKIESSNDNSTRVQFLSSPDELKAIYEDTSIVKLFFKQHYKYSCHSLNWGSSKGKDCFNDVCVVLNQNSAKHFVEGRLNYLPPTTRNKLYVACSRARGNLFFIKQADLDQLIPRPHT